MRKINKKAQLGKFLTSLPVMIFIFVIIVIYLAMSFAISGLKSPSIESKRTTLFSYSNMEILLRNIEIGDENGDLKNISFFDALINKDSAYFGFLIEKFKEPRREEMQKLVLITREDFEKNKMASNCIYFLVVDEENLMSGSYGICRIGEREKLLNNLFFTSKHMNLINNYNFTIVKGGFFGVKKIQSYYGECPFEYCKNE
ncbi:MAG: hypothetical protein N3D20_01415 [Candidatus Pacearchaeota archaeon]|nr:hypothetical protein [Candidatus Pacearchaeota archaeon]